MAVYVDDMQVEAEVPNGDHVVRGRWSHLVADSEDELRAFAKQLGLRESWIQHPGEAGVHFDVTAGKRAQAIKLGARPITWREAGQMNAQRVRAARERCGDIDCTEQPGDDPGAERPAQGRVRHSWSEVHEGTRTCQRDGCGMDAEQRWNPATGRPVVIYSKNGRSVVAERVPPCGSELPDPGVTAQEAQHLADAAGRKAGEAFRAGDLDRAFRLVTDARVLDRGRSELWDQREERIRQAARQMQATKDQPARPEPDSPEAEVIAREEREWAEWNRLVGARVPEKEVS